MTSVTAYFNDIINKQLEYKKKPIKLSGISTGGRSGGCFIYGKKHYLIIGKESKTSNYGYAVKELKPASMFAKYFLFIFFVFLDVIIYIADNPPAFVVAIAKWIEGIGKSIGEAVSPVIPQVETSPTFALVFSVIFMTGAVLFLYLFWLKGLARFHGTEHRAIAAAENEDIQNYEKYSVVNDRCGGTFILSIYAYLFIAIYFIVFILGLPGYGVYTLTMVLMFLEAKYFHHYNVLGIIFGRVLQRKLTTKEPFEWQNEIGKKGIAELMKAEKGETYLEKEVLFDKKLKRIPM